MFVRLAPTCPGGLERENGVDVRGDGGEGPSSTEVERPDNEVASSRWHAANGATAAEGGRRCLTAFALPGLRLGKSGSRWTGLMQ